MAIMGEVIAKGKGYSVTAFGPWLDVLEQVEGRKSRNNLVRVSLENAGLSWADKFLGRRFTNYVMGAPFFYHLGVNAGVRKFRRMGLLQPILAREFYGWDPWSHAGPPKQLIEDYRRRDPTLRGFFSRSGNYITLSRTIRRDAKRIVRDMVDDLLTTKIRPLVESGQAERTALAGRRVIASSTKGRSRLVITIPFGGPKNAIVGQTVRTMPEKEVGFIARLWAMGISDGLRGRGIRVTERGAQTEAPRAEG